MGIGKNKGIINIVLLLLIPVLIVGVGIGVLVSNPNLISNFTKPKPDDVRVVSLDVVPELTPGNSEVANSSEIGTPPDLTKLPLGDKKYSSSGKIGFVYACKTEFTGGGANTLGPWGSESLGTWDLTKKVSVSGSVAWPNAKWSVSVDGTKRVLTGNGLPSYHNTGVFPVQSSDTAYKYDKNPNTIKEQAISLSLPTNPTLLTTPECVGGEVGIMLSGVPIYNAFDAGGRDAVAWEVQDSCEGHPQQFGGYHYHGPSSCLKDNGNKDSHSDLVGYAFDGFGIYGVKGAKGIELSSKNLDMCHGHTHSINLDGKQENMYHYHLTNDFPYSVSCFRGKAVVKQASQQGANQEGMGGMQRPGGLRPSGPPPPPNGLP